MEVTTSQLKGLKVIVTRYRDNEKYTVVAGYA